jgi:hypothetical protein
MILTQLIRPEDLAKLSDVQVNVLAGIVYTEVISNEQIRNILREKITPHANRLAGSQAPGKQ